MLYLQWLQRFSTIVYHQSVQTKKLECTICEIEEAQVFFKHCLNVVNLNQVIVILKRFSEMLMFTALEH